MRRDKTIMLRLTEEEKRIIDEYAKTTHTPAAGFIRATILKLIKES